MVVVVVKENKVDIERKKKTDGREYKKKEEKASGKTGKR